LTTALVLSRLSTLVFVEVRKREVYHLRIVSLRKDLVHIKRLMLVCDELCHDILYCYDKYLFD
jgi:hypothetical protein